MSYTHTYAHQHNYFNMNIKITKIGSTIILILFFLVIFVGIQNVLSYITEYFSK